MAKLRSHSPQLGQFMADPAPGRPHPPLYRTDRVGWGAARERRDAPIGRGRTSVEPEGAGRRLAAIMFTDIVGYTALMAQSEAKGLRARARHRALVQPLVERYHGQWIESPGDQSLSTFGSALDAVDCALAIQDQLRDDAELKLHLGIHLGDVVVRDGEVSGDGVNIASRICALSEGGGLCGERAVDCIKGTREGRQRLVTGTLYPLSLVLLDQRTDDGLVSVPSATTGFLIPRHQGRVAHDVGEHDRGEAALGHAGPSLAP